MTKIRCVKCKNEVEMPKKTIDKGVDIYCPSCNSFGSLTRTGQYGPPVSKAREYLQKPAFTVIA